MMNTAEQSSLSAEPRAIHVRGLTVQDLPAVAAIHLAAFPASALAALGVEAVRRYYEWQFLGPHDAALFGAECDGELAGYCFSGVFRGAMSGFLRRHRAFLVWRVTTHPWLIFNSLFRDRLAMGLNVMRRFRKAPVKQTTSAQAPVFGILAIATHPKFQGRGIGKHLMAATESAAAAHGASKIHLSVNTDNQQAIAFYESLDWRKVLKQGVWTGEMMKPLALQTKQKGSA